tara:strand:+ start:322 stop:1176 length:855 start_codon:yes stop_codon:yes gene_type:complete
MASIDVNIGSSANDGTGDSLRTFATNVAAMFAEVYGLGTSESDLATGTDFKIKASQLKSLSPVSGDDTKVVAYDHSSGGFSLETVATGDITSIIAGTGMTGSSLGSGDATINVIGGDGITANADEVEVTVDGSTIELNNTDGSGAVRIKDLGVATGKLANDAVTHDKIEGRYTATLDSASTGNQNLDASSYSAFNLTGNVASATLTIQNMKKGQVIDIILSGSDLSSAVITLADDFTTSDISRVGSSELDTSKKNIIQVLCVDDDDSDAILMYAISTYQTATTP